MPRPIAIIKMERKFKDGPSYRLFSIIPGVEEGMVAGGGKAKILLVMENPERKG